MKLKIEPTRTKSMKRATYKMVKMHFLTEGYENGNKPMRTFLVLDAFVMPKTGACISTFLRKNELLYCRLTMGKGETWEP